MTKKDLYDELIMKAANDEYLDLLKEVIKHDIDLMPSTIIEYLFPLIEDKKHWLKGEY